MSGGLIIQTSKENRVARNVQRRERHAQGGQDGSAVLDRITRRDDVVGEPIKRELAYFKKRLNRLDPPLAMLIRNRKSLGGDTDPQLGTGLQLLRANVRQLFERLFFVVTRVRDEERGLVAGGITKIGGSFRRQ